MTRPSKFPVTGYRRRVLTLLTIALVMAMGGGAFAAVVVGSKQVKDGSVLNSDLANQAITSRDVKNDSLTDADFAVLPEGPKGAQGQQGARGPTGQAGYSFLEEPFTADPGFTRKTVLCEPAGRIAVHGGMSSGDSRVSLRQSAPVEDGSGWILGIQNDTGAPAATTVQAFCVFER